MKIGKLFLLLIISQSLYASFDLEQALRDLSMNKFQSSQRPMHAYNPYANLSHSRYWSSVSDSQHLDDIVIMDSDKNSLQEWINRNEEADFRNIQAKKYAEEIFKQQFYMYRDKVQPIGRSFSEEYNNVSGNMACVSTLTVAPLVCKNKELKQKEELKVKKVNVVQKIKNVFCCCYSDAVVVGPQQEE